jgi:TolB protein
LQPTGRLTSHAYVEYGVAFSPDGSEIAYGRESREGIYLVDFDGRDDRRLTRDSPRSVAWGALSWSPDGSALAYTTNRIGDGDVYVIGADGRGRIRLTSSPDNDIAPEWAPR